MKNKITKSLIGGTLGTVVMTIVMMIAPMLGMPKMSPPEMLSMMMGFPIIVGWILHFVIGIIFALSYAFFILNLLKNINSNLLKGAIFGFSSFILGQIAIGILGAMMGGMPATEGNMILVVIGSIMGHVIFGMVVAMVVKEPKQTHKA